MKLDRITKEKAEDYSGLFDEVLLQNDLIAGAGCLDDEENPIGAALLDSDGDRLIISSIFVEEESRRKGAGSLMLDGILEMSKAAGTKTVEAYFTGEEAESFFLKNSFLVSEAAPIYRVSAGTLKKTDTLKAGKNSALKVHCLRDIKNPLKKKWSVLMEKSAYLSHPDQYDKDFSFLCTDEDGNPVSFILSDYLKEEGVLRVEQLMNTRLDHPEYAVAVINAGLNSLNQSGLSPETEIEFVSIDERIFLFIEKITEGKGEVKNQGSLLHAVKVTE